MHVKPLPDRTVHDPEHGNLLPPEGRNVPDNQYWFARLECGDVIQCEPPAEDAPASARKTKSE